jgi:hypothetical protein
LWIVGSMYGWSHIGARRARMGNKLAVFGSPDADEGKRESFIHIHLAPIADYAA